MMPILVDIGGLSLIPDHDSQVLQALPPNVNCYFDSLGMNCRFDVLC